MKPLEPATDAARIALSLALGRNARSATPADWRRVHAVARGERLAALAWLRSGEHIRRHAPPDVVALWRAESVAAAEFADRQLQALSDIARAEVQRAELPFVLKGIPLADLLYGDASVRVCCDIDLFVAAGRRASVHAMLTALGWEHWLGTAPYDASYRRTTGDGTLFLEVHSLLASEALAHCPLTPDGGRLWSRNGLTVRTLEGPVAAVYLAANLTKHGTPALVSYVDLATFWNGLDATQRESAYRLAEVSRLARCLRWALARATALPAAAAGDPAALRRLGFSAEGRKSTHAFIRLMWLADRPTDAARILATWTWPRSLRNSGDALMPFWGRRMRRSFVGRFRYSRAYAPDATPPR
jgi:hypothetical protein